MNMATGDRIRNPIEWGWDALMRASLAVQSAGRSLRGNRETRDSPLPVVRRIKAVDLKDVFGDVFTTAKGWALIAVGVSVSFLFARPRTDDQRRFVSTVARPRRVDLAS